MTIPESLQHFSEPALIVVADHFHAKFLLAFEDSIEEIDRIELPASKDTDNEGQFVNTDSGGVSGPEREHDEMNRLAHFVRQIAGRVNTLIRDEEAAMNLHLLAPTEVANGIKKELAPEASRILGKDVHADVMQESEIKILERLRAA
ncbi:MAG TPA: host attachment protein [Verrucomicrobiae bacterium]|nr:host attachment protein [Verrucomicrobiae bacterium]